LSEDQAGAALKFFGDINLVEIIKQAHYCPPEEVVTWVSSVDGPVKKEAKEKTTKRLSDYEVYDWIGFLLENTDKELEALVSDIGGNIGISEDDLPRLKRTIEVFAAINLLEIDDEDNVKVVDDLAVESSNKDSSPQQNPKQEQPERKRNTHESDGGSNKVSKSHQTQSNRKFQTQSAAVDLSVSFDATEMTAEELREKIEIIKEVFENDAE
jgi:hypothetical protein